MSLPSRREARNRACMDLGCQRGDFNKFFPQKVLALLLVQRDVFGATASRLRQFLHKRVGGRFFAFRGSSCLLVTNSVTAASVRGIFFISDGRLGSNIFAKIKYLANVVSKKRKESRNYCKTIAK